jgi:hypothetical protein
MSLRKCEAIVRKGLFPVFIATNQGMTDFLLLAFDRNEVTEEMKRDLRSMSVFVGVAAIVDGRPRTALNVPLEADAIATLSQAVVSYFSTYILMAR